MINIKKKYSINNIHNSALSYINKFGTSKNYLTQFLINKIKNRFIVENINQLHEDVESVVNKLVNLGYINDTAFCESRIKNLLKEGYSIFNITIKLQQKQISKEIIESAFNNIISNTFLSNPNNNLEELEMYSLLKYAKKRKLLYWQYPIESRPIEYNKNKAIATLQRKGFSFSLISNLLTEKNNLNTSFIDFTTYLNNIENNYNL